VSRQFSLLIADRNRHVRDLLKRELTAVGYQVQLAKSGQEVITWAFSQVPVDLVILDPDLPDSNDLDVLKKIADRIPVLPVVIHSFLPDYADHPAMSGAAAFVEKRSNSIEDLKQVLSDILGRSDR